MVDKVILRIAQSVRAERARPALLAAHAKLYSQQLRRDMSRPGLPSYTQADTASLLDEAMLLVECGLIEREEAPSSNWRASLQRAAQIVEWLSQDDIRPTGSPLHLIAAAIYQVAELPAMALGHLRRMPVDEHGSVILRDFLRGDFPGALDAVGRYWRDEHELNSFYSDGSPEEEELELSRLTEQHVVKCIGTICAYLRTGGSVPVERALAKLDRLALTFLHSRDPYSFLLARLIAASARRFAESCLWPHVERLRAGSSERAGQALVQFARAAFMNRRALVWPAQVDGIRRLQEEGSFVLCTPTGSGKTTIATLGVVQGLFAEQSDPFSLAGISPGNLILYLVPSRALAAEVEQRLSEDLRGIDARPVVVTGLYGGVDWGPTDAWTQSDDPAIVICTFEKADALIRYLGALFLHRVRLVVIDEAHMVELDPAKAADLAAGTSRALRLEQLGMRLLRAQDTHNFRIIALSAVAAQAAPAIARWLGGPDALPVTSNHRSTRQMVGKLEVSSRGAFSIRYDLMDGQSLLFNNGTSEETPYVPAPFGPVPGGMATGGPDIRMRSPTLWAALNLAKERSDGLRPAVLISITQQVGGFAKTCADLMDLWQDEKLPAYSAIDENDRAWTRCLASAADYFTDQSAEYRLLKRGIAVHHGQLPPLLARRLKVVIDRGLVRVIIATSTLSEGVNIPVNAVLIPSLFRGTSRMSLQEFTNLLGRAGRPGVSSEGASLAILPEIEQDPSGRMVWNRQRQAYDALIKEMLEASKAPANAGAGMVNANSPLQNLLDALRDAWAELDEVGGFDEWLSRVAVIGEHARNTANDILNLLDPLDAILIAALQEIEQLKMADLEPAEIESELSRIWSYTYAAAAAKNEEELKQAWLTRGLVINQLYPDPTQRRRIYRTSLAPRSATVLMEIVDQLREILLSGYDYAHRSQEDQLDFIAKVLESLAVVPAFEIKPVLKKNVSWKLVLRWWLACGTLQHKQKPRPDECTKWFKFANDNFIYRGNWGLGGLVSLLMDNVDGVGPVRALEIDDWPRSGLPWITFWLKELVNWGTLDPVAAFLLARGNAVNRRQAEADAKLYYEERSTETDANNLLDPREIRDWVHSRCGVSEIASTRTEIALPAKLIRPADTFLMENVSVSPLSSIEGLTWLDPAGNVVAKSDRPEEWIDDPEHYDFDLQVRTATIFGSAYLRHRHA
ncbi:DEAD/DEAH box helicase [Azospirillum brasilense]|uniref:DEAD/DEAH box helicase n=1 Tax=Azospirillum brasilense TaxID=192 RepID=UPI000E0B01C7|nr:DEAD/DEAH box helicase [Azospirillum brasilense]